MELNEFDDLVNLGKVTRKVRLLGHEIVMETLDSGCYSQAMAQIPDNVSDSRRLEAMQREMIGAAIKTIDGKPVSVEMKKKLMANSQLGLSNILYSEYISMVEEQGKILEDAKKNSSQALKP